MVKPSRPAIVALVVGASGVLVHAWDWIDRSNALDVWLKANGSSPLGQFMSEMLGFTWVVVFVGLLFWYHDSRSPHSPVQNKSTLIEGGDLNELKRTIDAQRDEVYQANAARYEMRVERAGLTQAVQVVASQRDHVQAELRDLHRSIAETMVPRTTAQTLAQERDAYRERLGRLTPLVTLHRYVAALTTRLQSFRDDMEEVQVGDRDQELHDIARIAEENATAFARAFRPDLVRLAADVKQRFGLVYPGLTDEALARDVRGQSSLDQGLQGLRDMKDKIRDMLLDEALEIDDK
jgi:hypothetical protein